MGRGEESNSIYVGGLKFSTDSDALIDYFGCYGKVLSAKVQWPLSNTNHHPSRH